MRSTTGATRSDVAIGRRCVAFLGIAAAGLIWRPTALRDGAEPFDDASFFRALASATWCLWRSRSSLRWWLDSSGDDLVLGHDPLVAIHHALDPVLRLSGDRQQPNNDVQAPRYVTTWAAGRGNNGLPHLEAMVRHGAHVGCHSIGCHCANRKKLRAECGQLARQLFGRNNRRHLRCSLANMPIMRDCHPARAAR